MRCQSRRGLSDMERRILDWLPDYDISESGEVRRITRPKGGPCRNRKLPYALSQYMRGHYLAIVAVPKGGRSKPFSVHRLVCEAFHGTPEAGMSAAHNDGNPLNNHFSNLRWATPQQNSDDKRAHKTDFQNTLRGNRKLLECDIPLIRGRRAAGEVCRSIASDFDISISQVHRICNGETWSWL